MDVGQGPDVVVAPGRGRAQPRGTDAVLVPHIAHPQRTRVDADLVDDATEPVIEGLGGPDEEVDRVVINVAPVEVGVPLVSERVVYIDLETVLGDDERDEVPLTGTKDLGEVRVVSAVRVLEVETYRITVVADVPPESVHRTAAGIGNQIERGASVRESEFIDRFEPCRDRDSVGVPDLLKVVDDEDVVAPVEAHGVALHAGDDEWILVLSRGPGVVEPARPVRRDHLLRGLVLVEVPAPHEIGEIIDRGCEIYLHLE